MCAFEYLVMGTLLRLRNMIALHHKEKIREGENLSGFYSVRKIFMNSEKLPC